MILRKVVTEVILYEVPDDTSPDQYDEVCDLLEEECQGEVVAYECYYEEG